MHWQPDPPVPLLVLAWLVLVVVAPPVPLAHWHMLRLLPSALHVWTPMVPPRHAHDCVMPGRQEAAPVELPFPPLLPQEIIAPADARRSTAANANLDESRIIRSMRVSNDLRSSS